MSTRHSLPPAVIIRLVHGLLAPWRRYTRPVFIGLDRIPPERPLLFVGNHTLYAVLDAPLLFAKLYETHNIFIRALGDRAHFEVPIWRDFLKYFGVVCGTRENCAELMKAGEAILVFPGGGREVAKRKGEKYKLIWGERRGFARMAIEHGCTIVPFSSIGVEDAFDILLDADDILDHTPLGALLDRRGWRRSVVMPIARGIGPTMIPRREQFFFQIGEPIDASRFQGRCDDLDATSALRDEVRDAIEEGIEQLKAERERRRAM